MICGDAHVGNFGFYGSPERELVLDLNDFDEAHPGGWEWDLRRLAASIWVAGRQNGFSEDECETRGRVLRRRLPRAGAPPGRAAAAGALLRAAGPGPAARRRASDQSLRKEIERAARRARDQDQRPGAAPVHRGARGRRRIVEEPPLITRLTDDGRRAPRRAARRLPRHAGPALAAGARRLHAASTWRTRWSVWAASGCAPTSRCARAAAPTTCCSCSSSRPGDRCIAPFVHGESAWHAHQGQRVVEYQQALQTVSDPLLGLGDRGRAGSTTSASSAT